MRTALRIGITESEFWDMTLGEIIRRCEAYNENRKQDLREKANFDYQLAGLIGMYVSKCLGSKSEIPSIEKVYPNLWESEENETQKVSAQDRRSAANFMAFAAAYNARLPK